MKKILFMYCFMNIILEIKCGHILIVHCVPTASYTNIIEAIVNTIASEHKITFLSFSHKHYKHPNVTLNELKQPEFFYMKGFENIFEKMLKQDSTNDEAENILMGLTPNYIRDALANEAFENLLKTTIKYDMLITFTSLSEYVFQFASVLDIPLVQIAATFPTSWQNEAIGNLNLFSIDNNLIISEDSDTFYNRLIKYLKNVKLILRYKYIYITQIEQVTKLYYPSGVPSIGEISKNTSLLIVNTHEAMHLPTPTLPNFLEIGGLHCKPAKLLSNDLIEFINGANETGLIYVSFGSTIQSQFPKVLLNSFINVFRKIPQRIIWKVTKDMEDLPNNVKAMKWCPQQDILGHKNTKLFISQGGLLSLQESLYHQVPVLVMPLSFDQPTNARIVRKLEYGRYLRFTNFSEENFQYEITEILSNKKYERNVIEVSYLLKEGQKKSVENLKWWINYLIRNKGNTMNKFKEEHYHWARWIEIDIIVFLILFTVISLLILMTVPNIIIRLYMKNSYTKDKQI